MAKFKAFTFRNENGLSRALTTPCGVCVAFNPLDVGTPPPISQFITLWDTGASGMVISKNVVSRLNLKPTGVARVFHANGESLVNTYLVNIFLPNQVGIQFIKVTEGILNSYDLLIGMDIISSGDFSITNVGGKTTFSFRMPSVREIDYLHEDA